MADMLFLVRSGLYSDTAPLSSGNPLQNSTLIFECTFHLGIVGGKTAKGQKKSREYGLFVKGNVL